jgi:hypothetical protein
MYNKSHICTYQFYEPEFYQFISEKFNLEDVEGFEIFSEELYRADLTKAFNSLKIDDVIKLLETFFDSSENMVTLFAYDFFYLTHQCISSNFEKTLVDKLLFVLAKQNIIIKPK